MAKITPEQWVVWTSNDVEVNPNDCWSVAGPEVRDNKSMRGYSREQAHLIAAAPVLLASLKECADDLEAFLVGLYGDTLTTYPSQQRRYDRDMTPVIKARAAIAKAEGRTSAVAQGENAQ